MTRLRFLTHRWTLTVPAIAIIGLAACTTTPTGTTKDIFDFTSSTTDRAWFTIDGQVKSEYKARVFVEYNQESLLQDIARGQGEHLTSMATLLNVPPDRSAAFRSMAQAKYSDVAQSSSGDSSLLLQSLVRVLP